MPMMRAVMSSSALARTVLASSVSRSRPFSAATLLRTGARRAALTFGLRGVPPSRQAGVVAMATQARKYPYGPEVSVGPEKLVAVGLGATAPAAWSGDLLVVGVFEDALTVADDKASIASPELQALDGELGGALADIVALYEFKGKAGSSQTVRAGKAARFVTLVGLGPADKASAAADWGRDAFTSLGAAAAAAAKTAKAKTAAVAVLGGLDGALAAAAAGRVANGVVAASWESTRFKTKPTPSPLGGVEVLFASGAAAEAAVARGVALAHGSLLTRYLVEAPPNVCTPSHLAEAAAAVAASAPEVMKLEVLEKEDCEALGMGLYLGVAEASAEPPKFIHLTYTPPGGDAKRKVAIVGKGLTFDSGGYNVKAGAGSMIELMKFDMGGSGATLGAAQALAAIKPAGVEVHFLIASCENMIDGRGCRPGDILVASNGKTVEINNTDAEGRLTLADAILYAQTHCGAEAIVDIATLTGACMIALGDGIAGMYANSEEMAAGVAAAGRAAGEKLWRMPLEESYMEQLKSPVADYKNSGGRLGGSITAALFLREFIIDPKKTQWAHLDIAGPVWNDKAGGPTGYGAQLLAEWAEAQGK